jgi:hypothetical protein
MIGYGPWTCTYAVELRGRLSNPDVRQLVWSVQDLFDGKPDALALGARAATRRELRAPERVRVRLGDAAVAELVATFVAGTTREMLVDRYGVSLSSVKRLLRGSGARRPGGPAVGEPKR